MRAAREIGAALSALGAYLTTVLPPTRKELRRWRKLAEAMPDPQRRRQALSAIDEKGSNVEAVAVFATLAPRRRRHGVVRAIVPLQVAIDYLDTLEEAGEETSGDGYLAALQAGWVRQVELLPACGEVVEVLRRAVDRSGEGQHHTHGEAEGLRSWAAGLDGPAGYRWWELAAGASSSVAAHALIAAAADTATTRREAELIDAAYNPSVGALTVILDNLVDRERDATTGDHNYLGYYADPEDAANRIAAIAHDALGRSKSLPRHRRHRAILAGVASFYLSYPGGSDPLAAAAATRLTAALGTAVRLIAWAMAGLRRLRL